MLVSSVLKGGIGNQLFQIATVYALSKELQCEYAYLRDAFEGCGQGNHPRMYYDNVFRKVRFVDSWGERRPSYLRERTFAYHKLDVTSDMTLLDGYFQSERYFKRYKDDIIRLFTPDEGVVSYLHTHTDVFERFPDILHDANCFLGVRRGDYLNHKHIHLPCDKAYFDDAMDRVCAKKYFVMSDDLAWCKEHFQGPQFVFIDIEADYVLLYVMALFRRYIISNSTFHWWGSYLSIHKDKIVIAPKRWINIQGHESIYRDDMTVLDRF